MAQNKNHYQVIKPVAFFSFACTLLVVVLFYIVAVFFSSFLVHVWLSFEKHISSDDWFEFMKNLNYSFMFVRLGFFFSSALACRMAMGRSPLKKDTLHSLSREHEHIERTRERMHKLISCFRMKPRITKKSFHHRPSTHWCTTTHSHQYNLANCHIFFFSEKRLCTLQFAWRRQQNHLPFVRNQLQFVNINLPKSLFLKSQMTHRTQYRNALLVINHVHHKFCTFFSRVIFKAILR